MSGAGQDTRQGPTPVTTLIKSSVALRESSEPSRHNRNDGGYRSSGQCTIQAWGRGRWAVGTAGRGEGVRRVCVWGGGGQERLGGRLAMRTREMDGRIRGRAIVPTRPGGAERPHGTRTEGGGGGLTPAPQGMGVCVWPRPPQGLQVCRLRMRPFVGPGLLLRSPRALRCEFVGRTPPPPQKASTDAPNPQTSFGTDPPGPRNSGGGNSLE